MFLAHFNKRVTSQHVKAVAKEMDYEMALVEDLLAVGANPEYLELQFLIIALGSSVDVDGDSLVPFIQRSYLSMDLYAYDWDSRCRFLFIKKQDG